MIVSGAAQWTRLSVGQFTVHEPLDVGACRLVRAVDWLLLTLTIPKGQVDVDKIRRQMMRSMPPGEAVIFEKPG